MTWKVSEYQQTTVEERARAARDDDLQRTDWVVAVADHSQFAEIMAYRQALRDWPQTGDFPDISKLPQHP